MAVCRLSGFAIMPKSALSHIHVPKSALVDASVFELSVVAVPVAMRTALGVSHSGRRCGFNDQPSATILTSESNIENPRR